MQNNLGVVFGARLRTLRQNREFSQQQLAADANLDRSYISQLEGGRIVPSLTTLNKLAISLNIPIGELLDFKIEHPVENAAQSKRSKKRSNDEIFGDILSQLRKKHGLSQQQLAEGAGIDRSFVSRLERGLVSASITTIFNLAKSLEIKPSDLIRAFEESMIK